MIALGGAVATAATAAVGNAIGTAITYRMALDSPAVVKSVYDIDIVLFTMIGFTIAIISGATAIAAWRARIFPQWYGALSALATLVFVSGGAALTFKGFYSPTGGWSFVSFIVFLVWVLLTTVLLMMRAEAVPTGRAVTT